jgi:hypothetical protein
VEGTITTITLYGGFHSVEVSCPSGKVVIGGGCVLPSGYYDKTLKLVGSWPYNDTTWMCMWGDSDNPSGEARTNYVQTFAICAVVTP